MTDSKYIWTLVDTSLSGISTEQCVCFVSNRILEDIAPGASLCWDVMKSKTKKQADRGFLHSLPSFLKQNFGNLHKEEKESVLVGIKSGGSDREQVWRNVLDSF